VSRWLEQEGLAQNSETSLITNNQPITVLVKIKRLTCLTVQVSVLSCFFLRQETKVICGSSYKICPNWQLLGCQEFCRYLLSMWLGSHHTHREENTMKV